MPRTLDASHAPERSSLWQARGDAVRMCEACLALNRTCDGMPRTLDKPRAPERSSYGTPRRFHAGAGMNRAPPIRTCDGIASHPESASCAQAIIRWHAKGDAVRMCEACLKLNRTCDGIASHPISASCALAIIRWQARGDSTLRLPRQPAWNDAGAGGIASHTESASCARAMIPMAHCR